MVFITIASELENAARKDAKGEMPTVIEDEYVEQVAIETPPKTWQKSPQLVAPFPIRSVALLSIPSILVIPALLGSVIAIRQASRWVRDFLSSLSS
jgi:hypothetical protein